MEIGINLQDTDQVIINAILRQFRITVNAAMRDAKPTIQSRCASLIKSLVAATPEYAALLGGDLRKDLGLLDPGFALTQIMEQMAKNVVVYIENLSQVGNSLEGGLTVGLLRDNYGNLINLPTSHYKSNEYDIPWLNWLLLEGNTIVVASYGVHYTHKIPPSRAGGFMYRSKKGIGWRVPPEYSGVADNNFLTRAFTEPADTEQLFGEIIEEEILKNIN